MNPVRVIDYWRMCKAGITFTFLNIFCRALTDFIHILTGKSHPTCTCFYTLKKCKIL